MSKPETSTAEILVHLVRAGLRSQDYQLAHGATLADLLRTSGDSTTNSGILIDGVSIEESFILNDGAVVTIAAHRKDDVAKKPWNGIVTAFQDDALFQEYMEILKENRRREREEDLEE